MRHVCTRVPKRRNPSFTTFTPSSVMDVEVFFLPAAFNDTPRAAREQL
jgi:hypothetical protein